MAASPWGSVGGDLAIVACLPATPRLRHQTPDEFKDVFLFVSYPPPPIGSFFFFEASCVVFLKWLVGGERQCPGDRSKATLRTLFAAPPPWFYVLVSHRASGPEIGRTGQISAGLFFVKASELALRPAEGRPENRC